MPFLNVRLQGRFGNQCMIWLFCNALCRKWGYEMRCEPWIGEKVFTIPECARFGPRDVPVVNEMELEDRIAHVGHSLEFSGYAQTMGANSCGQAQMRECMVYTKKEAQQWFKLRAEFDRPFIAHGAGKIICHLRRGDFKGYGYPMVGMNAYLKAVDEFGLDSRQVVFLSEENPMEDFTLPNELSFVPDFVSMMRAKVLLRANSTFSFVAGLLGNGLVLSPRIDGLRGGMEHDNVRFEAGNHCKLADFDFCSDLHVSP